MSFNVKINNVTADSYVVDSQPVPVIERNRDLTLTAPRFTMDVLSTFGAISVGQEVRIFDTDESSTYPKFVGTIIDIQTIQISTVADGDTLKRLTIRHIWGKLEDFPLSKDVVDALISAGSPSAMEYNSNDGTGPVVQILYLMEQIFSKTGYNLAISSTIKSNSSDAAKIEQAVQGASTYWIRLIDLSIDVNMLLCANQEVAVDGVTIQGDPERRLNTPTLFEIFSLLCSALQTQSWSGFVPRLNTSTEGGTAGDWTLFVHSTTTFSPTWSEIKEVKTISPKTGGYSYELNFNQDRSAYQDNTEDGLIKFDAFTSDDGKTKIPWYNNFVIGYRDMSNNTNLTLWNLIYSGFTSTPSSQVSFQASAPGSPSAGDLWYDSDDSYKPYAYDSAWRDQSSLTIYNRNFYKLSDALANKISTIDDTFTQNEYRVKKETASYNATTALNLLEIDLDNELINTRQEF